MSDSRRTETIVLIGIMAALITGVTMIFKVPIPGYGYINLGDMAVMLGAVLLPVRGAVFAAGIGSALADILTGYHQYAIFTLFIKAAEVIVITLLSRHLKTKRYFVPFFLAGFVMALLYAILDGILLADFSLFWVSLTYNLPQGVISALFVSLLFPKFKKLVDRLRSLEL